ncbi:hypothetical protein KCU88_g4822, partial [Aureobasidium melanogenum]
MGPATEKSPDLIQLARSFNHIPWCDEFERMISGMLYNPNHPDLVRARVRCRNVSEDYNRFSARTLDSPDQIFDARLKLLKEIVGGVGDGTFVEAPFTPDYGCNVLEQLPRPEAEADDGNNNDEAEAKVDAEDDEQTITSCNDES